MEDKKWNKENAPCSYWKLGDKFGAWDSANTSHTWEGRLKCGLLNDALEVDKE